MQKTTDVGESTMISLFLAGLQEPMKHELLTKRPDFLKEAFALAQRSAASQRLASQLATACKPLD